MAGWIDPDPPSCSTRPCPVSMADTLLSQRASTSLACGPYPPRPYGRVSITLWWLVHKAAVSREIRTKGGVLSPGSTIPTPFDSTPQDSCILAHGAQLRRTTAGRLDSPSGRLQARWNREISAIAGKEGTANCDQSASNVARGAPWYLVASHLGS